MLAYFTRSKSIGTATALIVLFCLIVRSAVSSGSYSGQGTPPMFGDYEAQRHWMEITTNLPIEEWYQNTSRNNLTYWGLDYPPLTAYHSYLIGEVSKRVEPASMELYTSRGYETPTSKLVMRLSSLLSECVVLIPALVLFFSRVAATPQNRLYGLWVALLSPALILIDHGHFQYNSVSLGLAVWAVLLIFQGRVFAGSICFCMALCFKQIALYYSFAFFFFLLGQALSLRGVSQKVLRLATLGVVVVFALALCFSPWIYFSVMQRSPEPLVQVFRRIFPFNRGLFEDKVANFWCCTGLVIKWRERLEMSTTLKLCSLCTALASLPSGIRVLRNPNKLGFLYCLASSSLGFFLFSYHVHEKSILFPLLPLLCLAAEHPRLVRWAAVVSCFSMFPLLRKDGLAWQYAITQLLFITGSQGLLRDIPCPNQQSATTSRFLNHFSFFMMLCTHAFDELLRRLMDENCPAWLSVPQQQLAPLLKRYPDLGLYAFAVCSFVQFAALYLLVLWAHYIHKGKQKKNQ